MAVAFALKTKTFNHKEKLTGTGEVSYEAYIGTEGYGELNTLVDEILDGKIVGQGIFTTMDEINGYSVRWIRFILRC